MKLNEKLNIHDELNPKIWTEDAELREEVEEKLFEIVDYFVEGLEVPIDVLDAHIVGSNASYNYSEYSDLDLHIVANFDLIDASKEILQAYYNSARASFNKSHDITIHGVNVELYVEDVKSTTLSNGIYSLFESKWIKFPKKLTDVPEVDVSREAKRWFKKINKILEKNDYDSIKNAINQLYLIRKNSLSVDGEYGKGNQIFKEVRNVGLLDELKDNVSKAKSKVLSLESLRKESLQEATRTSLISKSKGSAKGNQRYKRRNKSKVANSVKQFNSIDMNKLFKDNILTVNVSVNGETDNYTVRISFGGFLDILHDELEKTDGVLDLRVITRALLTGFNRDDVFIHCSCPDFCLEGGTKIKLLNGEIITAAEMLERFSNGEEMYVYSTDEKGDFKPGKVNDVWISGFSDEMLKVTLDNGEEIITTPNHRYMMRDGSYKEASELQVGQSLMPMYFRDCNGYETVKFNSTGKYHSVYKQVADFYKQSEILEAKNRVKSDDNMRYDVAIHHIDFNKKNNLPDNLKVMTAREHWDYHAGLTYDRLPIETQEKIKRVSFENAIKRNQNPTPAMIEQRKRFNQLGTKRNYDKDRKAFQSKLFHDTMVNWWGNVTDEQRAHYSELKSQQFKDAWQRGCYNTEARKEADRKRALRLHTPEMEKATAEGIRNYWKNLPTEEKEKRDLICRENIKKAQDATRGVPKTEETKKKMSLARINEDPEHLAKRVENFLKTQKSKTEEQIKAELRKNIDSRMLNVIKYMFANGIELSFENYANCRKMSCSNAPRLEKYFDSVSDVVKYFNLSSEFNHKIAKVEIIKYDSDIPVYDISVEQFNNFTVDAGVVLHNCYRFAYWSTRNDFNSGEPQYDNGKWIRNPDDKLGSACKHTLLVLSNNTWLLKVASVINNYIKYMEKHYQKAYADIIYPAIYGKKYEKDVQLGFEDSDELASETDTEIIDVSNEEGRKSTQFQKGNQSGLQFAKQPKRPEGQLSFEDEEEI